MRIIALVENTLYEEEYKSKHGLCFYIETPCHKMLFDLGPDNTFLHNAEKAGVDISDVDTVIISHGHYDHGGALKLFFQHNSKAKVYINKHAFSDIYAKVLGKKFYIGLDKSLENNERIIFTDKEYRIDNELLLFSDADGQFLSRSNRALYAQYGDTYARDDFRHEQNLIIQTAEKAILFSGCSHRGITNIYQAAKKRCQKIDVAIGGFHLFNPSTKISEPTDTITQLAIQLSEWDTVFYTCHCTGKKAYDIMRDSMGEQLHYFATGKELNL